MAHKVIMPRQGQSVEACILTRWYKKKGDRVEQGDLLFAFETDKAAFDEEAGDSGFLLETYFSEGDEVPVLATVAVIGDKHEKVDESFREQPVQENREEKITEKRREEPKPEPEQKAAPTMEQKREGSSPVAPENRGIISPRARKLAEIKGVNYASLSGSGPGGRIIERDIIQAWYNRPRLTPLAEAKRREQGMDTAPKRISGAAPKTETTVPVAGKFTDQPLSRMRKIIAEKMFYSLAGSAQLTHHIQARATKLLELRKKIKPLAAVNKLPDITLNDLVCFAAVRTLRNHPEMNAHFLDDRLRLFEEVHLGFAVETDRGLMVPVVNKASALTLQGLCTAMKDLSGECQAGSINPDLLQPEQASFTVTNLGSYGIDYFTPILNLPQVAILGVNTIRYVPRPDAEGKMTFIPVIGYSLTYDHRAVDGAPASRFLRDLCDETENLVTGIEMIDG